MAKLYLVQFSGDILYDIDQPYMFGYLSLKKTITAHCERLMLIKGDEKDKDIDILTNGAKKLYSYIRKTAGTQDFVYRDKKPREYSCACESKCECETKTIVENNDHRIKSWIDLRPFLAIKQVNDLTQDMYIIDTCWTLLS